MREISREEAAHHEAGHFVVGFRLRPDRLRDLVSVGSADDGTAGRTVEEELWQGASLSEVEDEVVVLFSGYYAHVRLDPDSRLRARLGAKGDDEQASRWLERRWPAKDRPRVRRRLRTRARRLVAKYWQEVQALAAELLVRNALEAEDAGFLIDAAGGDASALIAFARSIERRHGRQAAGESAARLGYEVQFTE